MIEHRLITVKPHLCVFIQGENDTERAIPWEVIWRIMSDWPRNDWCHHRTVVTEIGDWYHVSMSPITRRRSTERKMYDYISGICRRRGMLQYLILDSQKTSSWVLKTGASFSVSQKRRTRAEVLYMMQKHLPGVGTCGETILTKHWSTRCENFMIFSRRLSRTLRNIHSYPQAEWLLHFCKNCSAYGKTTAPYQTRVTHHRAVCVHNEPKW